MSGAPAGAPAVSAPTRHLVHAFLVVFLVCGFATLEVFPFSGFRLFSQLRGDERESWQLRAVDDEGQERSIVLGDLPLSYRKTSLVIGDWEDLTPGRRDAICDAWAGPLRASGVTVTEVRIYRVVQSVRPHAPPPDRRLAYTCGRASS